MNQLWKKWVAYRTSSPLAQVSWHSAAFYAFFCSFVLVAFYQTPLGDEIERAVSRPVEFSMRIAAGKEPQLNEKIKLISFDDFTLTKLKKPDMSAKEWGDLIALFQQKKPKAIFIDRIFQLGFPEDEEYSHFKTQFQGVEKSIVGAFLTSFPMQTFERVPLTRREFGLENYLAGTTALPDLKWLYSTDQEIYGPHRTVEQHVKFIGHILYDGKNRVIPWYRLKAQPDVALPYAGLGLADRIQLDDGNLYLDGKVVPLDRKNSLIPNLISREALRQKSYALAPFLARAQGSKKLPDFFNEGDIIMVLPTMYTGSGDIKSTALGDYPGPYVHASLFNSIVSDNWLKPLPAGWLFILMACVVGGAAGFYLKPTVAIGVTLFGAASLVAIGVLGFIYLSIVSPWLFTSSGFLVTSLLVVAGRARNYERNAQKITATLQGLVAPNVMEKLFKNPEALNSAPSEHVVSVMFVDMVGFSLAAETLSPEQVFVHLKDLLNGMSQTIHKFGGVVDKTLGDGLLCFFGYNYDGSEDTHNHAMQAVFCAEAIQKQHAEYCVRMRNKGYSLSPLRIGINSGAVYLGNVGNNQRIDFTIIGHCVNYARRLEEACESFRVMIGPATHDHLKGIELIERATRRRDLHIKHHAELWEAFEYDPFFDTPELAREAVSACRESQHYVRKEPRFNVPVDFPIFVIIPGIGKGRLVDFSSSGIAVQVDTYLAQKVRVTFHLDSEDGFFRARCLEHELFPVEGEVRWGRPADGHYQHGILVRNLNENQRELLLNYLRDELAKYAEEREHQSMEAIANSGG